MSALLRVVYRTILDGSQEGRDVIILVSQQQQALGRRLTQRDRPPKLRESIGIHSASVKWAGEEVATPEDAFLRTLEELDTGSCTSVASFTESLVAQFTRSHPRRAIMLAFTGCLTYDQPYTITDRSSRPSTLWKFHLYIPNDGPGYAQVPWAASAGKDHREEHIKDIRFALILRRNFHGRQSMVCRDPESPAFITSAHIELLGTCSSSYMGFLQSMDKTSYMMLKGAEHTNQASNGMQPVCISALKDELDAAIDAWQSSPEGPLLVSVHDRMSSATTRIMNDVVVDFIITSAGRSGFRQSSYGALVKTHPKFDSNDTVSANKTETQQLLLPVGADVNKRLYHSLARSARRPSQVHPSVHRHGSSQYTSQHPVSGDHQDPSVSQPPDSMVHRAFVALGSNLGDRLLNMERACVALDAENEIQVRRTSGLWETEAMYMVEQGKFLNGVCEVETTLTPLQLLEKLQSIETFLGRERTIEKGPRTIDLDILLYDNEAIQSERLNVPHKLMLERGFVLQPLCELIPQATPPSAPNSISFAQILRNIVSSERAMTPMTPLAPFASALTPLNPSRGTRIMSILNITPDSFSDGGVHSTSDLTSLETTVRSHLSAGATIIDVGGQSTRPNAVPVTGKEEQARVLPVIQLISSLNSSKDNKNNAIISIDTYRASVAQAAVEAGAHIVNDISAGMLDPNMLSTVARLGCTVVLMHMRGDPSTMTQPENTSYPNGLIETIGAELLERVQAAERAGIRRWRIILDPGIGFAKTGVQNLELLRRFGELREFEGLRGFPWLVGTSRKGFIGQITGVKQARYRAWGTAAAVTAAVQGGADIVRVHDVDEMVKVVKMADAIWRA